MLFLSLLFLRGVWGRWNELGMGFFRPLSLPSCEARFFFSPSPYSIELYSHLRCVISDMENNTLMVEAYNNNRIIFCFNFPSTLGGAFNQSTQKHYHVYPHRKEIGFISMNLHPEHNQIVFFDLHKSDVSQNTPSRDREWQLGKTETYDSRW